jgi:carbamoyltransferase
MITWGISANSHDAALAVFHDDKLVFASHSERFSGVKNDRDLNVQLLAYARQHFGGHPDKVVWYEQPFKKTLRQLWAGQGWKRRDNDIDIYMARYEINAPVEYVSHHHSHAAAGYYTSGFDDACVLVIDAIGEFETMTIWKGQGNNLTKLWSKSYPHSLGLFYSAMTQRIGLKPNEDEYITMGMAAYGRRDLFHAMITDIVGSFEKFTFKKNLHRGCLDWRPDLTVKDSFEIAATTQYVYEHFFIEALRKAEQLTKSKNLVLMGGCALNCLANRHTGEFFDNTWIMPNPGDAGSAMGAVLAKHPEWRISTEDFTPFLGYDMGSRSANEEIVNYLEDNKICGLARGRAEFGPRALGNRSLLADPRGDNIKDKVNAIKQRQEFRPFAPAILEELCDDYFNMPRTWNNSRYMQVVAHCRNPELFPAIVHRDGTSRVQTIPSDGSPFRLLLEKWYAQTGCPMLLNTSLNIKGQPMVNDHADAKNFERHYGVKVFN